MTLSFLSDNSVTATVLGQETRFYPITVRMLFKARQAIKSVAKSLALLFEGGPARDYKKKERNTRDAASGDESAAFQTEMETEVKAPDPRAVELARAARQMAIDDILDTMLNDSNMELFVGLVQDSIRVPAAERANSRAKAEEFLNNFSADALMEIVLGMISANKAVFSPLEKIGRGLMAKAASQTETTGN